MTVSIADVDHVAKLARLALSEQEKERLTEQLNAILKYVEKLNELNTEQVEPTSHVLPLKNIVRSDIVKPSSPLEEVLKNAPEQEEGHFRIPAVLE
jgi:aspartyl-tRNA(Asn)/glutamyl-tRNA(Gln) amidotransferase subunit C